MTTHKVMDQTGHTEHAFDPANIIQLEEALDRFNDLTKNKRYIAAADRGGGTFQKVTAFDPAADLLFMPPLDVG